MNSFARMTWSKNEKTIARKAFDKAYEVECRAITSKVRAMTEAACDPEGLWKIHDYLDLQRRKTDAKYDYRYSVLILVLAQLLKEGWLEEVDLTGFNENKLDTIKDVLQFSDR